MTAKFCFSFRYLFIIFFISCKSYKLECVFQKGEPVIVVDWSIYSGYGSREVYETDCGLILSLVGVEITNFIKEVEKLRFYRTDMHLIGAGIGGKISARVGQWLSGQLKRITGKTKTILNKKHNKKSTF